MPSVNFVLPHWLYWSGLIIFPLVAMILARRSQPRPGVRRLSLAYFLWLVAGFIGIHRFYVRNPWGMLYWPLFALVLIANSMERDARVVLSDAEASVTAIASSIARTERSITKAERKLADTQKRLEAAKADGAAADDPRIKRYQRTIARQEAKIEKARAKIADLEKERADAQPVIAEAASTRAFWSNAARYAFFAILALMAIDAVLLPGMVRKANERLAASPEERPAAEKLPDDWERAGTGWKGMIDRLSLFTGEFVAWWAVIAVFAYYYEVVVRYVFNSPTNWVHESMFLMFGMQYLIGGAYAMLTDSHVRVDIFYAKFSERGKAIADLLTSVFFFIFAGTLLVTGWIFARDSIAQGEVSFTEWAIQYWPVKVTIVVGGVLLILQGIAKLARDFERVVHPQAAEG